MEWGGGPGGSGEEAHHGVGRPISFEELNAASLKLSSVLCIVCSPLRSSFCLFWSL